MEGDGAVSCASVSDKPVRTRELLSEAKPMHYHYGLANRMMGGGGCEAVTNEGRGGGRGEVVGLSRGVGSIVLMRCVMRDAGMGLLDAGCWMLDA